MSIESKLSVSYKAIAAQVSSMIPVAWDIFYLHSDISDESGSVYFYYKKTGDSENLYYSQNILKDIGIDKRTFNLVLYDLLKLLQKMRNTFIEESVPEWYTFSMSVTAKGKMKADFGYISWQKSEFSSTELRQYFVYKFIGKEYSDSSLLDKMEEMSLYEEQNK